MPREPLNTVSDNLPLLKEWDYEKNAPLGFDPCEIGLNSHHKVWWRCANGHSWQALVNNRSRHNRGCPYCSHQLPIKGETDLATCYPNLAKEWHPTKNKCNPDDVMPGSHKKAWWICDKGHEWEAQIKSRTTGVGCPYCAGKKVLPGFNDLATIKPDLAAEWHPTKNGDLKPTDVTAASGKRVWWVCKNRHEFQASIYSREPGTGCPKCIRAWRSSFPEQAVFYYIHNEFPDAINGYRGIFDNAMELDIYIPSLQVGIEYDGKTYHSRSEVVARDEKKYWICRENEIGLIRIIEKRDNPEQSASFCDYKVEIENASDDNLNRAISKVGEYLERIIEPNVAKDRKKILHLLEKRRISLATKFPDIASEWDFEKNAPLVPENFAPHANEKVFWKCKQCGYSWAAMIGDRTGEDHNGCPRCADKAGAQKRVKTLVAKNGSLAERYPELLREWDYSRNEGILPEEQTASSSKKVWWKCRKCGHIWKASIGHRTHGRGCPLCAHQVVVPGVNDFATLRPWLMADWDYVKNDKHGLDPTKLALKSGKRAYWKCSICGNEWQAVIATRSNGVGCPACWNARRSRKQPNEE